MIIWGTKGFKNELGPTRYRAVCRHCNNEVTYTAIEYGKKFSLFFIPLVPFGIKRMIVCPIFGYGYEVSKDDLEKYM
ncbi:zinc-ribbon domain-containing protein [Helcococcus kunzii]